MQRYNVWIWLLNREKKTLAFILDSLYLDHHHHSTHLDHVLPHYDHHFTSLSPSGRLSTIHREHTYRKHKNTAGKVETHRNMKIHEMKNFAPKTRRTGDVYNILAETRQ